MIKSIIFLIFTLFLTVNSYAKIADPKPLVKNGIEYSSHLNTVTATRLVDKKFLWKAVLPIDSHTSVSNSNIEADVQMNIISQLTINTDESILAIFKAGQAFSIQIKTGKWKQLTSLPG